MAVATLSQLHGGDYRPAQVNVIGVQHSGTRSVAAYHEAQGKAVSIFHLQHHYITAPAIEELIANHHCVLALRDPMLALLSTAARRDDKISRVIAYFDDLFALTWPEDVIAVERDARLPVIGAGEASALKAAYRAGTLTDRDFPALAAVKARRGTWRTRLEAAGYDLPWLN